MIREVLIAASVGLVAASAAVAAPVSIASQGSVLVQRDGKYVSAASAGNLRAGDRIVAMRGSQAGVSFADGCRVSVEARTSFTVGDQSPCGGGAQLIRTSTLAQDGYGSTGAVGAGSADLWMFLGFGLLTIGVTASALDDDEKPVSP